MSQDPLSVRCAVCEADVGQPCITLGQKVSRAIPHAPRDRAARKAARQSESLSYGVRCATCDQWKTSCTCET